MPVARLRRRATGGALGVTQTFANAAGPRVDIGAGGRVAVGLIRIDDAKWVAYGAIDPGPVAGGGGTAARVIVGGGTHGGGTARSDTSPPAITSLSLQPARLPARGRTRVRYAVSEPARVRFRLLRRSGGARRRQGEHRPHGQGGAQRIHDEGPDRPALPAPGPLHLIATATDAAGNRSKSRGVALRILARRR